MAIKNLIMFPTSVSQPNRDESSGLDSRCFEAVTRSGGTYEISCTDQRDPKYHHEWSNAEELLKGGTIQCGRPSTRMCSHETYYGIAGYRNTCPIAGVTGTYTQPATLRVYFDIEKKGIPSSAKIHSLTITFDHRCTGVDVADGREYVGWGPNFSGADVYPEIKPLKVQFAGQEKVIEENPPLSWSFTSAGTFVFENITFSDIQNSYVDIIYGNNLETNPGNIYLKTLRATIAYEKINPFIEYLEGDTQEKKVYISKMSDCRTSTTFNLEAGYKVGANKVAPKDAPKLIQRANLEILKIPDHVEYEFINTSEKTITLRIKDNSYQEGLKGITVGIKNTTQRVILRYRAVFKSKPTISIPTSVKHNVNKTDVDNIAAFGGCVNEEGIKVYADSMKGTPFYHFKSNEIDLKKTNILKQSKIDEFYRETATKLSCGWHTLFFKRGSEANSEAVRKRIQVIKPTHKFKILIDNEEKSFPKSIDQDKENSYYDVTIKYVPTNNLIKPPVFKIHNNSYIFSNGKAVQQSPKTWNTNESNTYSLKLGRYYPGNYTIKIEDTDSVCSGNTTTYKFTVNSTGHKQHYDEIFVQGEDSTAFDYDYLVALEGDGIQEPVFVQTVSLGASYRDIRICTSESEVTGLTNIKTFPIKVKNMTDNDIENLSIELNPFILNEDGDYVSTTNEWLEPGGLFYNFKTNFEYYNKALEDMVIIRNLTPDDDVVDEEDVMIHIKSLKSHEVMDIQIPFGCNIEKRGGLQLLLFGEPILLYKTEDCGIENEDNAVKFDFIKLTVYDSILTEMNITGDTNLFKTITGEPPVGDCPNECFVTQNGIKYSIQNVDTSSLRDEVETIIKNDPRLIPYKFRYEENDYEIIYDEVENAYTINDNNPPLNIQYIYDENAIKQTSLGGFKVKAKLVFNNEVYLNTYAYTDYKGEVTFFVKIPEEMGELCTEKELLKYMLITYEGNSKYNGCKLETEESVYSSIEPKTEEDVEGELIQSIEDIIDNEIITYPSKLNTTLSHIDGFTEGYAGQILSITVKLKGDLKYMINEFIFNPKIKQAESKDELIIYYKICNLRNNEGILQTCFKTGPDEYRLIENGLCEDIYCGVDTRLDLNTELEKIVVENKTLNRLHISLENKIRNNNSVRIEVEEETAKYSIENFDSNIGIFEQKDNKIIWNIGYIAKNKKVYGYIDFEAENLGYSKIKITAKDFIDDIEEEIDFGEDSYKCECRKQLERGGYNGGRGNQ